MTCGIYKITNTINGKFYIGASRRIEGRWEQHFRELEREMHSNISIQEDYSQQDGQGFITEVLIECEEDDLFKREFEICCRLDAFNTQVGYNKRPGKIKRDNTFPHIPRQRDKDKYKMKGVNFNLDNPAEKRLWDYACSISSFSSFVKYLMTHYLATSPDDPWKNKKPKKDVPIINLPYDF